MKIFNRIKGDIGENIACKYLIKNHYKILERNFKNSIGEIDIIARHKKEIVFVEVKSRTNTAYGVKVWPTFLNVSMNFAAKLSVHLFTRSRYLSLEA